ncbi:MAG: epoxyqueuosine reductase QueH [Nitrospinota bacterium]
MAKKERLLLHICCGPCAGVVMERLSPGFEVGCFFYNPNIHPAAEYRRRAAAFRTLLSRAPGGGTAEALFGPYDHERWLALCGALAGEPEGGMRCRLCYGLRLERAAEVARERGYALIATTLSVSPHKRASLVSEAGEEAALKAGLTFYGKDFKKGGGFERSLALSRELALYRQRYCGCRFSLEEALSSGARTRAAGGK